MTSRFQTLQNLTIHFIAGALALLYAWEVSQTAHFKTGLQFVAPVLIIIGVHFAHLMFCKQLTPGFSDVIYRRGTHTAGGLALLVVAADSLAPSPAQAADSVGNILVFLFCGAIVVIIMFALFLIFRILLAIGKAIVRAIRGNHPKDDGSTRFDFGSLIFISALIAAASLEGLPGAFDFNKAGISSSSRVISAQTPQVWNAMTQATSAAFPLPDILRSFPKPIDVVVDEGVHLGARREVKFQGREGTGCITLQVVERTETSVRFEVLSDTTPYAAWVTFEALTYHVIADNDGTRLDVTLEFEGQLAPAWLFKPAVKGAAYLAMDVLARDVKQRTESQNDANI